MVLIKKKEKKKANLRRFTEKASSEAEQAPGADVSERRGKNATL